jgi:hypothetical protein
MAFLVRSSWTDPTTTASSGHGADGRGGIVSWGRGAMTMIKVKKDDDDQANAMMTITTTAETTMTICMADDSNCQFFFTVNRIVGFNVE